MCGYEFVLRLKCRVKVVVRRHKLLKLVAKFSLVSPRVYETLNQGGMLD